METCDDSHLVREIRFLCLHVRLMAHFLVIFRQALRLVASLLWLWWCLLMVVVDSTGLAGPAERCEPLREEEPHAVLRRSLLIQHCSTHIISAYILQPVAPPHCYLAGW
jgi:hypothetical protein